MFLSSTFSEALAFISRAGSPSLLILEKTIWIKKNWMISTCITFEKLIRIRKIPMQVGLKVMMTKSRRATYQWTKTMTHSGLLRFSSITIFTLHGQTQENSGRFRNMEASLTTGWLQNKSSKPSLIKNLLNGFCWINGKVKYQSKLLSMVKIVNQALPRAWKKRTSMGLIRWLRCRLRTVKWRSEIGERPKEPFECKTLRTNSMICKVAATSRVR